MRKRTGLPPKSGTTRCRYLCFMGAWWTIRLFSVLQGGSPGHPLLWHPLIELSTAEQAIMKRICRVKLFVFPRQHRHALFVDPFP
jgi:hypothetical protein